MADYSFPHSVIRNIPACLWGASRRFCVFLLEIDSAVLIGGMLVLRFPTDRRSTRSRPESSVGGISPIKDPPGTWLCPRRLSGNRRRIILEKITWHTKFVPSPHHNLSRDFPKSLEADPGLVCPLTAWSRRSSPSPCLHSGGSSYRS